MHLDEESILDHIAITGRVYASKSLARAIKSAQWKLNVIYNAAIDAKRNFSECVKHSIEYSKRFRGNEDLPERPPEGEKYRPIQGGKELFKQISKLVKDHSEIEGLPLTAYVNAADEAERARKKHVQKIVDLKPGEKPPKLRFRSMKQAATIRTENFRLYERRGPSWKPGEVRCRSDSPKATIGKTKLKLEIKGLPRFNVNLSRPIPEGAEVKQVALTMEPNHGGIRVSLTCTIPTRNQDELAHERAWAVHQILREMPDDLPAQEAIAWARQRGIRIRGDDLGIASPSVDDQGNVEPRVAPNAKEIRRIAVLQRQLAHKDAVALDSLPVEEKALVEARKKKPPKRSRKAQKIRDEIKRHHRKMKRRSRTAAHQNARRLVKDIDIIATDPPEMAAKLIRKGGPAERRKKQINSAEDVEPVAQEKVIKPPSDWMMNPAQRRAMRRNMAATGGAFRIRRVSELARQAGILHITPGNAGTSRECPQCKAPKDNALNARFHKCSCGCKLPRDQASAQVTAARALYALKESPDPGDIRAQRELKEAEARQKATKRKAAMAAGRLNKKIGRSGPSVEDKPRDINIRAKVACQ